MPRCRSTRQVNFCCRRRSHYFLLETAAASYTMIALNGVLALVKLAHKCTDSFKREAAATVSAVVVARLELPNSIKLRRGPAAATCALEHLLEAFDATEFLLERRETLLPAERALRRPSPKLRRPHF